MINNLKFGLKSFRYAYGIKSNIFMALFFLVAGIIMSIQDSGILLGIYGDFMLMCISMLPAQLLFSLSASNMILASPMRKRLQTSIPATVTCGVMMFMYLVMTAGRLVRVWKNPQLAGDMSGELMVAAVMMVIFMAYLGVAYKYFVISILVVVAVVLIIPFRRGWAGSPFYVAIFGEGIGGVALTALLGMGILAAGGFLQYLISLLLYRAPMAKMAQAAPLRREL